jgi:hypothetical protein
MAGKSFYEVLESQIRAELRAEFEAQYQEQRHSNVRETASTSALEGAQGRLETWLVSHVEKTHFSRGEFGRRAYGNNANRRDARNARSVPRPMPALTKPSDSKKKTEAAPRPPSSADHIVRYEARTLEELCLVELLRRHGAEIGDSFTTQELKTAWRKVALKTHPDRFTQADPVTQKLMAEQFRAITEAYGDLAARIELQINKGPLAA